VRGDFDEPRRPEVGHFHQSAVGYEHVARPQIAMEHSVLMRVIDGVADLAGVIERAREIDLAVARDHRLERVARHVLHHDEKQVRLFFCRENRDDVRVIQ
jgi:hypothetical protein